MANTNSLSLTAASNQWAVAADSATLSVTGNLTIQAWIKRASIAAVHTIAGKWDATSGSQRSYMFRLLSNNTLQFRTSSDGAGSNAVVTTDTVTSTSVWTHVAAVFTAASHTTQFYINASASQSGDQVDTAIFDGTARFGVGGEDQATDTPVNPYDGLIDEVRLYNIARNSGQISGDYQQELTSFTNVQAYYKLNNGYTDTSGNSNTLTAKGSPTFSTDVPFIGSTATAVVSGYAFIL